MLHMASPYYAQGTPRNILLPQNVARLTLSGGKPPETPKWSALRFSHFFQTLPMPFEQTGPVPLTATCHLRLTQAEKARLLEDAQTAGLSLSEYVRRRALGRSVTAHADEAVIRELRRLGGLVKHLHNESGGVYSKQTSAVLVATAEAISRLAAK